MASDESFVTYVCDQMAGAGHISSRQMFGEYAIYCGVKVVALVCGNQLFIKPTPAGKTAIRHPVERVPYPAAKPHYLVTDRLDDQDWLALVVAATAHDLPEPKPKKLKAARKSK